MRIGAAFHRERWEGEEEITDDLTTENIIFSIRGASKSKKTYDPTRLREGVITKI
ncbi:hypothetical protein AA15669_0161 [Saccharibacter floricola DSM 15669]|uniref:Uncharacterized protein n=1 Tax=Saccharibacter floricola DSM 15669 TaxID=1123227 RepID=A0ABQ0NW53_9PROT|nr:hypothetical protein AA15669_0161 [Saccharibacter floricola DSM 15669]